VNPVLGQMMDAEIEALCVEHLERVYLACERGAVRGRGAVRSVR